MYSGTTARPSWAASDLSGRVSLLVCIGTFVGEVPDRGFTGGEFMKVWSSKDDLRTLIYVPSLDPKDPA